jgi:hypothetical protein
MSNNFENDLINNINTTNNILSQQSNNDYRLQNIIDSLSVVPDLVGATFDIASGDSEVGGAIAEVFGAVCEFIGGICN